MEKQLTNILCRANCKLKEKFKIGDFCIWKKRRIRRENEMNKKEYNKYDEGKA